ncbi:MAG: threonylcarbamoyl-AMP synthase [Tannerella sp.]|nr:threonylcarbamoyl-AMP synthase [Tannerella sp.]
MENYTKDIKNACKVLNEGGLILYPTDTIWGIGCDATNETAVRRVYELKKRTDRKAMLVLIDSAAKIDRYVSDAPDIALELIELADKPLTIIYPGGKNLAANLLGEDGSIGIRVTKDAFSNALCRCFRRPVVSTSANISGQPSPLSFDDIPDEVKNGTDYVVNYRQDENTKRQPSGIIRFDTDHTIQIIRK